MKLVVAIIHNEDAGALVDGLLEKDYRATRLHSSGGFLKQSNATIVLGVEDARVDEVMAIITAYCTSRTQVVNPMPPIMEPGEFFMPYPLEVEVGGATVFVLPVDRFERLSDVRPMLWGWLDELDEGAPDPVAAYRNIEVGKFITVRREVRRRTVPGSAPGLAVQLAALATALDDIVARLPEAAFAAPGGEGDWNVAQAIGHDAHARAGLSLAGALAASGRWPADAPAVVPGIAGEAGASREHLRRRIASSQRVIERAARTIEGHETDPCPLEHPQVGRLRCGEWLLFAGVHDLMHLDQLHQLEARFGPG